jgi:hypothetical protein
MLGIDRVTDQFRPGGQIYQDTRFGAADTEELAWFELPHGPGDEQQKPAAAIHLTAVDDPRRICQASRAVGGGLANSHGDSR